PIPSTIPLPLHWRTDPARPARRQTSAPSPPQSRAPFASAARPPCPRLTLQAPRRTPRWKDPAPRALPRSASPPPPPAPIFLPTAGSTSAHIASEPALRSYVGRP